MQNQMELQEKIQGETDTTVSAMPEAKATLHEVYRALSEKGYNPTTQIVGYLLTEDPTYITNYEGARALIGRIDRDELLDEIVRFYFEQKHPTPSED